MTVYGCLSRYKLHHLLFWLLYFCCWTLVSVRFNHIDAAGAMLVTTVWFAGHAGIVYSCLYTWIPQFFNKKRYAAFLFYVLVTIVISGLIIAAGTVGLLHHIVNGFGIGFNTFLLYAMMDNFFVAIAVIAIKIIKDRIKNEQRNQLLEKQKTENELRFLRSQINPHFLFNAINSIYVLIKTDPDAAAGTLAKFADMLRYQLYECNADTIPIQNEILYIVNYIELEKLRKGNAVQVNYYIDEQVRNFDIAPLLIIPFVENAFKFVSSFAGKLNFVSISLEFQDNRFELKVANTFENSLAPAEDKPYGGIGLENVKRRLELIYGDRHVLNIGTANNLYSVSLNIQI